MLRRLDTISFLFLSFLILGSALLILTLVSKKGPVKDPNQAMALLADAGQNYQSQARAVFGSYLEGRLGIEDLDKEKKLAEWQALLAKTKNDLLNLKLSENRQRIHLELILAIERLSQNLAAAEWEKAGQAEMELIRLFNQI